MAEDNERKEERDMHRPIPRVFWCAALLACAPAASFGQQQAAKSYPSKPIRLVVPFAAGGTLDFIGQVLVQKIAPVLGQNLFMDNRGGAGGSIGTDVVAKSPPDGYTMLLGTSTHTILPSVYKSLPYDPVKDFTPITLVVRGVGSVLVVHPSVPARSVKEFIALAKAQPGKLNYGSGGVGTATHFAAESFNLIAGTQLTHVPYKGILPATIDLLAGRIDVGFFSPTVVLAHIRLGKLRALGITAPARWSELADVPTMDEAGVKKGYIYALWYGLWFPAGTPTEYVTRIRAEVAKAFEDPATKRRFVEKGLLPVASTPQEFGKTIFDDIEFNRRLVAKIGLTPQ